MRKIHITALIFLCAGVLLTGVGTGIAFSEFSSLSYGGMQEMPHTELVTKEFDIRLSEDECSLPIHMEGQLYRVGSGEYELISVPAETASADLANAEAGKWLNERELQTDAPAKEVKSLPGDTIRFRVTYNRSNCEIDFGKEIYSSYTAHDDYISYDACYGDSDNVQNAYMTNEAETAAAEDSTENDTKPQQILHLRMDYRYAPKYDTMERFMQIKDEVLENLKHKRLIGYNDVYITQVSVYVPETLVDQLIYD